MNATSNSDVYFAHIDDQFTRVMVADAKQWHLTQHGGVFEERHGGRGKVLFFDYHIENAKLPRVKLGVSNPSLVEVD